MSKTETAVYEIHAMEKMAKDDKWINQLHPIVKLIVTVSYILTVMSFSKYDLDGLSGMLIYPLVLFVILDLSMKQAVWRLRIILPVVCMLGIVNPFFDRISVYQIGGFTITTGMISMVTLIIKGILALFASYLLIATTTIESICYALEVMHLPKVFITQIQLSYRYITVLLEEVNRMTQAYHLRAPKQKGIHYKAWGTMVGQLLLRSVDRAENVYDSMCLRGYGYGKWYTIKHKVKSVDYIYLIGWIALFVLCRMVPIFSLVGRLVVKR